jgi:5-methyltetrahydrofolate--homocysteine methyltransferase
MAVCVPRDRPHEEIEEVSPPDGCLVRNYTTKSREYRVNYALRHCLCTDYLGEAVPSVSSGDVGANSLALYLGCRGEEAEDTVWFQPFIDDPERDAFNYTSDNFYWQFTRDILRDVGPFARGRFLQAFPDFIEGLDTLAAMRGTEHLLEDLITRPDWVQGSLRKITDLYFRYYDVVYDLIRDEVGGSVFWTWGPGRTAKFQCDFSAMISPTMYQEFMRPMLDEMTARVSYSIYHWDGPGAVPHHDALLSLPQLDMIQWTPGAGVEPDWHERWWPLHHKTLDAGKKLMISAGSEENLSALRREFGEKCKLMHLGVWAKTLADAERCLRLMEF